VEDIRDEMPHFDGGNIHEFAAEIDQYDCWCEDGELGFYKVVINTSIGMDYDYHDEGEEEELEDEDF